MSGFCGSARYHHSCGSIGDVVDVAMYKSTINYPTTIRLILGKKTKIRVAERGVVHQPHSQLLTGLSCRRSWRSGRVCGLRTEQIQCTVKLIRVFKR